MKKANILLTLVLISMLCVPTFAQDKLKVGVFGGYATEIKAPAAGVKVFYGISDQLRAAPSFAYFIKSGITVMEVNLDANYLLGSGDSFKFYPLAGINYYISKVTVMGVSASSSEIGANLGAGIDLGLSDSMGFFAEAKYTLGNAHKIMATAGITFKL